MRARACRHRVHVLLRAQRERDTRNHTDSGDVAATW